MVQFCKYIPNSRCHLSSCIIVVLDMLLAESFPLFPSLNDWNVPPFCTHYHNNSVFSVNSLIFWKICCRIDVTFSHIAFSPKFDQQVTGYLTIIPWARVWYELTLTISYPTSANGIIVFLLLFFLNSKRLVITAEFY